jgi:hypothetical protein
MSLSHIVPILPYAAYQQTHCLLVRISGFLMYPKMWDQRKRCREQFRIHATEAVSLPELGESFTWSSAAMIFWHSPVSVESEMTWCEQFVPLLSSLSTSSKLYPSKVSENRAASNNKEQNFDLYHDQINF